MRLTANEIRENRLRLANWFSSAEMREEAQRLMELLGSTKLFNQSGVDFICEAFVAAEIGAKRGAAAVRLIGEERPDIALRFDDGRIESYELVEADRLDRKRGDEYAALEAAGNPIYHWPIEEWATPEQAVTSIRAMAEKKARKAKKLAAKGTPYPPETRLLIYVNLDDFGAHTEEIERTFSEAVAPARQWFSSIWVLWKSRVLQV
jgi:hypothetical protein